MTNIAIISALEWLASTLDAVLDGSPDEFTRQSARASLQQAYLAIAEIPGGDDE